MARWDLDRGVHALATAVYRVNYLPFVTIALLQAALQTLPAFAGGTAPEGGAAGPGAALGLLLASLLQAALLYLALKTLMTGERAAEEAFRWPRFWGFLWRLIVLGLPSAVVMLAGLAGGGGLFGLLSLLVTLAVLGLLGTALADVVAGGTGAFGEALERGRRTFGRVVGWILVGPVLGSLALGIGIAALTSLLVALGLGASGDGETLRPSAWLVGLLALLGALGGAYVAALTAAVLAKAWEAGGGALRGHPPRA